MPNDTYAGILNTPAAHDAFGEDARPFYPERVETFNTAEQIAQYKTRIAELERERDAAIADARALSKLLKEVDDANPHMAYSAKAYWVIKKYLSRK